MEDGGGNCLQHGVVRQHERLGVRFSDLANTFSDAYVDGHGGQRVLVGSAGHVVGLAGDLLDLDLANPYLNLRSVDSFKTYPRS